MSLAFSMQHAACRTCHHLQCIVVDLGFAASDIDKIVGSSKGVVPDTGEGEAKHREVAASALAQSTNLFGAATRDMLRVTLPIRAATIFPLWIGKMAGCSATTLKWLLLPRLFRLRFLLQYLRAVRSQRSCTVLLLSPTPVAACMAPLRCCLCNQCLQHGMQPARVEPTRACAACLLIGYALI